MPARTRRQGSNQAATANASAVEQGTLPNHSKQSSLTASQSLDAVKINIYGVLSAILRHRRCVDQGAFSIRPYTQQSRGLTYSQIVSSNNEHQDTLAGSNRGRKTLSAYFLLRNPAYPGGNKVLEWLENAIFPAVDHGALKAIQLRILEYDGPRAIETYEITLQKHAPPIQNRQLQGISWTMIDVTSSLNKALSNLHEIVLPLPVLPKRKELELVLSYNPEAPSGDISALFSPIENGNYDFAISDEWHVRSLNCGNTETAFDRVDSSISYLEYHAQGSQQGPSSVPEYLPLTEHRIVDGHFKCIQTDRRDAEKDTIGNAHEGEPAGEGNVYARSDGSSTPSLDRGMGGMSSKQVPSESTPREDEEHSKELQAMRAGFQKPIVPPSQVTEHLSQANINILNHSNLAKKRKRDDESPNTIPYQFYITREKVSKTSTRDSSEEA